MNCCVVFPCRLRDLIMDAQLPPIKIEWARSTVQLELFHLSHCGSVWYKSITWLVTVWWVNWRHYVAYCRYLDVERQHAREHRNCLNLKVRGNFDGCACVSLRGIWGENKTTTTTKMQFFLNERTWNLC